jgi:type IV pilus assembly protein PilE
MDKGFHLIEILITLAIISILTAFCLPLYSKYIVQTRRLEATTTLSTLAIAMEKFQIEHNTYEGATLAALSFSDTAKNNYHVFIQSATNNDYTLVAEPYAKQAEKDAECASLILHADNKKEISGYGKVRECW